ncbi:aminopeptidase P family protein [Devriesea agamarum]|uniref:aminopeptidase P family protein n=1 Tax=Devriesea agamarum TaxID=472569 RepID=UPI00071C770F|nr:aminopeptidase P family protein [Devriesea agamarum]
MNTDEEKTTSSQATTTSGSSETNPSSSDQTKDLTSRGDARSQRPQSQAFREFIAKNWDDTVPPAIRRDVADFTPARLDRLVQRFPNTRLVFPAGVYKVRSNDTDYRFRPHTAFAYYSGLGTDEEPDSVLVVEPDRENPAKAAATYFFRPRAGYDTTEFYADSRYGELWVGRRPTLDEVETRIGISCQHITSLHDALAKDVGDQMNLLIIREVDAEVEAMVTEIRSQNGLPTGDSAEAEHDALAEFASEQRLIKDSFEIGQLREAVDATISGFEEVVRNLPRAVAHRRGERIIEGVFETTARAEGNGIGYDTIAAAGGHACTLHWIRNDGSVREGDLVLIDAGVEVDSLYTADITRTLPISGQFTPVQRRIYDAVLEAADAAFAFARPGVKFRDLHTEAMKVIVRHLHEWGLLPCTPEESLAPDGQYHRRWMVHGTSHHLGMDVHDCAQARREMYLDAELVPGMVFTIEPGLYFMDNDLSVPEEMRGIGVRIEDDVLVTETGVENLSKALPRRAEDIERWMADIAATR